MANHWMMNCSFSYNSTDVNFNGSRAAPTSDTADNPIRDPTNRAVRDGCQYDYLTPGSGIGNVYVNAKWLFKMSGLYQLPFDFNVSAFYNARQGYPVRARHL